MKSPIKPPKKLTRTLLIILLLLIFFIFGYFLPKDKKLAPGFRGYDVLIAGPSQNNTMPNIELKNIKELSFGTIKTPNGKYEIRGLKSQ